MYYVGDIGEGSSGLVVKTKGLNLTFSLVILTSFICHAPVLAAISRYEVLYEYIYFVGNIQISLDRSQHNSSTVIKNA